MSNPSGAEFEFGEFLAGLANGENRAALAALRRGLGKGPGQCGERDALVIGRLPGNAGAWAEEVYCAVASLFGWYPTALPASISDDKSRNLGWSLRRLKDVTPESDGPERCFVALLNSHREDMPSRLRRAVGLLKAKEVGLNWAQLIHDLRRW